MVRPRVFHLITRYRDGGSERTTDQTLRALHESDLDFELYLGYGSDSDPDCVGTLPEFVTPVEFRSLRHYNPLAALMAVGAIARTLRRLEIDILHTHGTEAGIVGKFAGTLVGTPVVIQEVHGDPLSEDRSRLLNGFILHLERLSAPMATRIVVKSEMIRESYLERGIGRPGQYELIYHGVDLDTYRSPTESRLSTGDGNDQSTEDPVTVTYVGRLVDGKGLFDLIEAIDRLRARHAVELRIVGEGPRASDLQSAIDRRGLNETVSLLGYRDDVPQVLTETDVFAIPSYREGTPRVITEALAAGVPVVATRIAGIPEQVTDGETGYLIDPGDIDALAARLSELISSPDHRRAMGEAAADSVEQFDVRAANRRFHSLYSELVDAHLEVQES